VFEGILQPTHLILILIIVLVVFGPGKLPEIGGALGKGISELKRGISGPSDADNAAKDASANVASDSGRNVCKSCGAENPPGNQFCGSCGVKIAP
jgi:sec-independent protein translocase protein TatA